MSKKDQPPEIMIRVSKDKVRKTAKIARYIRILLYLGIAFLLFKQARAADVSFEVKTLKIGAQTLKVEVADNDQERSQGLMKRTELKEGRGMLFIFPQEQPLGFWMKNTLIPLTIGYFDKEKKLFQTTDMTPASPMDTYPPSYHSSKPAMYALEVPTGWFAKHKIANGASFTVTDDGKTTKARP